MSSDYNAKNYTEQGAAITHIGGKLIIDAGADITALVKALQEVGTAEVPELTQVQYEKPLSDLVGEDIHIGVGGAVTGTIKYVDDYEKAFGKTKGKGYFFPLHLGDEYEGATIKCKRISGKDGKEKSTADRTWVLRLTDGPDTVFEFRKDAEENPFLTLSFNQAYFTPIPEGEPAFVANKVDYGRFGNNGLYYESLTQTWEGTECKVFGRFKYVKEDKEHYSQMPGNTYIFAFALDPWFNDKNITVTGLNPKTSKSTDWVMKVSEETKAKGITVALGDKTIAHFDLSGITLLPQEEE